MHLSLKYVKVIVAGMLGSLLSAAAHNADFLQGPNGRLSYVLQVPRGFDKSRDKCPLVIVMHGIMSGKDVPPMPRFARKLVRQGYAVLRFDFNAQGRSDGDVLKCTIPTQIADARAVYDYARSLPFVSSVVLLGHSQGGVVAGMLAGELAGAAQTVDSAGPAREPLNTRIAPDALVLLAPGAVLKDYALEGRFLGMTCDPADPPEYVQVYWYKFSREYILSAQTLPIYEESALYQGPVCLVHGSEDTVVPVKYSDKYNEIYSNCEYTVIPRENHLFSARPAQSDAVFISFLNRLFPR